MKDRAIIGILMLLILSACSKPKEVPVVGLWEVTQVNVGEEIMTPVAKWFRNNADGSFQAGNGWTQNSVGFWKYDEKASTYSSASTNGVEDEFGAFQISFQEGQMIMQREEEGMTVVVKMKQVEELPVAPADQLPGVWLLDQATSSDHSILDSIQIETVQFIHIRPDKRFRLRKGDGTQDRGYWHMHGHKPELTLIHYNREKDYQQFMVSFQDELMTFDSQDEENVRLTYKRVFSFPE